MSNSWAKGSPDNMAWKPAARGTAKPKGRYVPPPAGYGGAAGPASTTPAPPAGGGKMKYVPPPTNAGEWNRPKKSAGSGPCQWKELAAKEDAAVRASRKVKIDKAEAKQSNSVGMSGNDRAGMAATKMEFDVWTKDDVVRAKVWARAEECRVPNKRMARGGRLHKFINILLNNCEYVNERLVSEKRYKEATQDPTMETGLELKKQFVATLAKRVLNKLEDEEAEQAYKDDDPDSDDSEGRAM